MDLVLRNLIIGGNIKFNDDSLLTTSSEISKLLGLNRNPSTQLTSFNDHVLMNKELEVVQYIKSPDVQVQTLTFTNLIGVESQRRPFTDSLAADFITAHGDMERLKLYIVDMMGMKIHVEGPRFTSTSYSEVTNNTITTRLRNELNVNPNLYDGVTLQYNGLTLQTVNSGSSTITSSVDGLEIYSSGTITLDSDFDVRLLSNLHLQGFGIEGCNSISTTGYESLSLKAGVNGGITLYVNSTDVAFYINPISGFVSNKFLNLQSQNPDNRILGASTFNLTESTGNYNPTPLSRFYHSGGDLFITNLTTGSRILLSGKDGSGISTTYIEFNSSNFKIYKPLLIKSDTPANRTITLSNLSLVESTGVFNGTILSEITHSSDTLLLKNNVNSSKILFSGKDSGGVSTTFMDVNYLDITMAKPVTFNKSFSMTSNTASERVGSLSTLYFTETSGTYSATPLSQIFQTAGDITFNNLTNSSRFIITGKNSSGVTSTYVLFSSTQMIVNTNIYQPTNVSDTTSNLLKRTVICKNMNGNYDPSSLLEMFDTSTGHGVSFFPNLYQGNLSNLVQTGDSAFITRSPLDNNAMVFCNYTTTPNGFRFSVTNSTTATVLLRSGNNSLLMGSTMTATEVNHPFKFTAATADGRKIQNLGSLEFTDINGSGTTSTITMNANNIIYDDNGSASKHTFKVNDGSGTPVEKTVFIIENDSIKVQTALSVRNNSQTNNQMIISTSTVNTNEIITSFDATNSTTSARNVMEFSCNQSSSDATPTQTKTTCMKLSTTEITNLLHTKLSTSSQPPANLLYQGGLLTSSFAMTTILTDTSPHSIGDFTIVNRGSYMINILYKLETQDATSELLECYFGTNTTSSSFATSGQYELSNCFRHEFKLNPATAKTTTFNTTFCCLIDTANTILYLNYQLNANIDYIKIGATYSITRLA